MNIKQGKIDVFSVKVKNVYVNFQALGLAVHVEDMILQSQSKKDLYKKLAKADTTAVSSLNHVLEEVYDKFLKETKAEEVDRDNVREFLLYAETEQKIIIDKEMEIDSSEEDVIPEEMMERITWKEFGDTGLIVIINQLLHAFGLVIVREYDDEGKFIGAYPAKTKFRGFSERTTANAYAKVARYMSDNHEKILEDSKD